MGKGYLIDSNIVIAFLDNKIPEKAIKLVDSIIDEIPNISIITKIEVLRFNSSDETYNILKSFIDKCVIFGLDEKITEKTISICKSNKIKLPDAIIAATAFVYDLSLITRNISDFKTIKDLELLNPWD